MNNWLLNSNSANRHERYHGVLLYIHGLQDIKMMFGKFVDLRRSDISNSTMFERVKKKCIEKRALWHLKKDSIKMSSEHKTREVL